MRNLFDDQLDSIVANVIRQQGLSFSSHNEAQLYLKKIKRQIEDCCKQGSDLLIEGLKALQEKNHGYVHSYVAAMSTKLLKHLHSSKKLKTVIEEITKNERSLLYFTEAVKGYVDCGDHQKELAVISVLLTLYPLNPQAYICFATLIWRTEGIAAADAFYSKVIELIQEPALFYFAADCFYKNGNKEKAKEIAQQALAKAEITNDSYGRQHLLEFIEKL
jgi:tetratricopeptide (TPR) repeat protein